MEYMVIAVCTTLLLVIAGILARNLVKRNWDVLSWRNLFLVGYAHFVLLSGYFTVGQGRGAIQRGAATTYALFLYAVLTPLFLFLFLGAATLTRRKGWFQRLIPRLEVPVTTPAILISIIVLMILSIVCAVLPLPTYLLLLGIQFRSGMAVTAAGLATYWALAHRFNPASWAVLLLTLGMAVGISTAGGIGRRDVVAVLVAVPWVWYFASLRYRGMASIAMPVAALAAAGVLFIAAYTAIRSRGVEEHKAPSVGERLSQISNIVTNPTISQGAVENLLYTDTAGNTMFIFNTYPSSFGYMPFHSLWWIAVNPVPRFLYPSKPEALGIILQKQMGVEANLGPGIIGQAWTEGGIIAVVIFALAFGVLYGAFDRALFDRAWNPFFVAVAGAGAGNVLAMPRGDVALFLIQIFAAMISSAVVLGLIKLTLGPVFAAFPVVSMPGARPAEESDAEGDLFDEALAEPV